MEQEALTSLRLLDFTLCLCLPEAVLLFFFYFLEMRSSFMQVKPVATQQCSVSVYQLMFVFVCPHMLCCCSVHHGFGHGVSGEVAASGVTQCSLGES